MFVEWGWDVRVREVGVVEIMIFHVKYIHMPLPYCFDGVGGEATLV